MESNITKVTVIVPYYNAASCIGRCARSLMEQTLGDGLEYVFVNDGSTDESRHVLESVIANYPGRARQVKMLHNASNAGSAFSRERGMAVATGEYVVHCDADDYVDTQMYADLYAVACATDADVVCSGYVVEDGSGCGHEVRFRHPVFPPLNDTPLDTLHFSLCNKLVRRSLIVDNGLHFFPGINCWEDLGLMFRVLMLTRKVTIVDKAYYHYRRVAGKSQTTDNMDRVLADHLKLAETATRWFAGCPDVQSARYAPFLRYLRFTAKIKMLRGRRRDLDRWKSTFPETNRNIMSYKNIPFPYRLAFYMADRLPAPLVKAVFRLAASVGL